MSSYALFARLSTLEGDSGDLQATVDALSTSKQDAITNAPVLDGQAIKVGSFLNKIGTKDSTLTVETSGNIIKLAVNQSTLDGKQDKFVVSAIPANTGRLFEPGSTNFRAINVQSPLSITATRNDYLTISSDTYTTAQVDQKLSNLIGTAPLILDTLGEIATSLNNDNNFSTTMINALANKANTSDTFLKTSTSTETALMGLGNYRNVSYAQNVNEFRYALEFYDNVSNGRYPTYQWTPLSSFVWDCSTAKSRMLIPDSLLVSNVDILQTLNSKASTSSLTSYAPLAAPALTGNATAVNLTVSGNLLCGSTNIVNELGAKATTTALTTVSTNLQNNYYDITNSNANYYGKSYIDNTASAWSSGLAGDASHVLSTGTNALVVKSKTGTPFDIMRIYNTGIVNFTSNVMFDAEPQDITFATTGVSYTLQGRFNSKQDSLTASTPANSTQLLSGTTLKALKAGTNITLTNDSTSVTINGPSTSGFQSTLTGATATDAHPILSGTTIKCLKSAGNLSLTSDGTSITINGSNTYTKAEVDSALNLKANLYSPDFT